MGDRETPLAEGVETRQEFGLSVVEAQLADGTGVHEPEGALRLQPLVLGGQTFRLVFHNDDNVVVVDIFKTFIHFGFLLLLLGAFPLCADQYGVTTGNKGKPLPDSTSHTANIIHVNITHGGLKKRHFILEGGLLRGQIK